MSKVRYVHVMISYVQMSTNYVHVMISYVRMSTNYVIVRMLVHMRMSLIIMRMN